MWLGCFLDRSDESRLTLARLALAVEVFQVVCSGVQLASLNPVYDFHHAVVGWGGESYLTAICRYGTIDGIHFGELSFLEVLQHACLEFGVLAYGDGDDEE
jgi:hypothetical protein